MHPFRIASAREGGFSLTQDGHVSRHPSFVAAAQAAGLGAVPEANVFDLARKSKLDTAVSFDGNIYFVALEGGDAARVESFGDAELWLARTIRATFPSSEFSRNA